MTDRRVNVTLTFATDAPEGDVLALIVPAANHATGHGITLEAATVHAFTLEEPAEGDQP